MATGRVSLISTLPGDSLDQLSPILNSLAPVREHVTAITNLELQNAYPGSHATSNSSFLSCAKAKLTESTLVEIRSGVGS